MQRRVVAHLLNGNIIKGITSDFSPNKSAFHIVDNNSEVREIDIDDLKALFFVKSYVGNPDYDDRIDVERKGMGSRIRVDFKDGETLIGYSQNFSERGKGFMITPVDPESNNASVFVNKDATTNVSLTQEGIKSDEQKEVPGDEVIIISCPSCLVKNKLKTSGIEMKPKCGNCGARLV